MNGEEHTSVFHISRWMVYHIIGLILRFHTEDHLIGPHIEYTPGVYIVEQTTCWSKPTRFHFN